MQNNMDWGGYIWRLYYVIILSPVIDFELIINHVTRRILLHSKQWGDQFEQFFQICFMGATQIPLKNKRNKL